MAWGIGVVFVFVVDIGSVVSDSFKHVFSLNKLYFSAVCSLCDFAVSNKRLCLSLRRYVQGVGRNLFSKFFTRMFW